MADNGWAVESPRCSNAKTVSSERIIGWTWYASPEPGLTYTSSLRSYACSPPIEYWGRLSEQATLVEESRTKIPDVWKEDISNSPCYPRFLLLLKSTEEKLSSSVTTFRKYNQQKHMKWGLPSQYWKVAQYRRPFCLFFSSFISSVPEELQLEDRKYNQINSPTGWT